MDEADKSLTQKLWQQAGFLKKCREDIAAVEAEQAGLGKRSGTMLFLDDNEAVKFSELGDAIKKLGDAREAAIERIVALARLRDA